MVMLAILTPVFVASVAMVLAFVAGSSAASWARYQGRFPVIGCNKQSSPYPNHYGWRHAPTGYCDTGGSLGSTEGIDRAHWRGWGRRRAHAHGLLVDGLGFRYPARITAYDFTRCHNCFGVQGYNPTWYGRLHVVSRGGYRGGARRGPFNVVINVVPEE